MQALTMAACKIPMVPMLVIVIQNPPGVLGAQPQNPQVALDPAGGPLAAVKAIRAARRRALPDPRQVEEGALVPRTPVHQYSNYRPD